MKLLLANPNTTQAVTIRIAGAARSVASPGTEIQAVTAPFGAAVISTRAEMAIAEHASLATLATHAHGCDAAIIGASLDSAVRAAREMLPCPVLGITEAALHTACMLGGRFGILALSSRAATITREMIDAYGLLPRMAGMRWLDTTPQGLLAGPGALVPGLAEAATTLVESDLADTVILIGAVMAGMPPLLQSRVPVPVLEGVTCAVAMAEALVRLRIPKATAGSYAALPARTLTGIDPALQARFGAP